MRIVVAAILYFWPIWEPHYDVETTVTIETRKSRAYTEQETKHACLTQLMGSCAALGKELGASTVDWPDCTLPWPDDDGNDWITCVTWCGGTCWEQD